MTELLRGKKPKKNIIRGDILEEFQGRLKTMKEQDVKRLIVQLLIMRVLKERFETQTIRGTSVKNIIVFLTVSPSRPALLKALEKGQLPVLLSDGVKQQLEKATIEIIPEQQDDLQEVIGESNVGPKAGSKVATAQCGRTYVKQKTTAVVAEISNTASFNYGFGDS